MTFYVFVGDNLSESHGSLQDHTSIRVGNDNGGQIAVLEYLCL